MIELTHRFVDGYQRAKHEKEVGEIFNDVAHYQSQLDLLRITDKMVAEASLSVPQIAKHVLTTLMFYLFTLPISLPGSIIHTPLAILAKILGNYLSRAEGNRIDRDQVAHYKIISAVVIVPIVYSVLGFFAWKISSGLFVAPVLLCTLLSGYMAVQTRPLTFTLKAFGFVLKFLFTDFSSLKKTRRNLQVQVRQIIDKYRERYDTPSKERNSRGILQEK